MTWCLTPWDPCSKRSTQPEQQQPGKIPARRHRQALPSVAVAGLQEPVGTGATPLTGEGRSPPLCPRSIRSSTGPSESDSRCHLGDRSRAGFWRPDGSARVHFGQTTPATWQQEGSLVRGVGGRVGVRRSGQIPRQSGGAKHVDSPSWTETWRQRFTLAPTSRTGSCIYHDQNRRPNESIWATR
jgi:hypothetical protein